MKKVLNYLAELERNKGSPPMKRSRKARAEGSGANRTAGQRDWVFNTHTETRNEPPGKEVKKGSLTGPGKQTWKNIFLREKEMET